MSSSGAIIFFVICMLGFVVMIALYLKSPVVTYFSGPQSSQIAPDPGKSSLSESKDENLYNDIGKGPLSFVREKGYIHHLTTLDIDKLSTEELLMTIHSYVDNNDILCGRKIRMGNIGDGGWEICDDPDVRPRKPCIIYSFGIAGDFSFDDDAAWLYGCHVYSFDPSMTQDKDQFDRSSNVHFYKIGLGSETNVNYENWSLFTFRDIRKKLGHLNSTVNVVKMDIESSEWSAITEMFESGELSSITQLLVEFHVLGGDRDYLLPRVKAIQAIERSGMKIFYAHKNHACKTHVEGFPVVRSMCYEVHYLRR